MLNSGLETGHWQVSLLGMAERHHNIDGMVAMLTEYRSAIIMATSAVLLLYIEVQVLLAFRITISLHWLANS